MNIQCYVMKVLEVRLAALSSISPVYWYFWSDSHETVALYSMKDSTREKGVPLVFL